MIYSEDVEEIRYKIALEEQRISFAVSEAIEYYNFNTLHVLKKAQRRERLLATAIALKLGTREAHLLAEATRSTEGGERNA